MASGEKMMNLTVIYICSVSPVVMPMSSVTDGLMATSGMVVNDLLSGVAAGVSSGSIVPTDLSVGRTTPMMTNGVPGVIENNAAAVRLVDVPVTSDALIAALNVPMLVSSGNTVGGAPQVVGSEVKVDSNPVVQQQQQAQQQPPASIPQEIATMSEHDLISYINPNCFEQGKRWDENED